MYFYSTQNIITGFNGRGKDVVIPEGTVGIAKGVFMLNDEIETVRIPASVKYVALKAFHGCPNLKSVFFEEKDQSSDDTDGLTIHDNAFGYCKKLTIINIPKHLKKIHENAFVGSDAISRLDIESVDHWCNVQIDSSQFGYTSPTLFGMVNVFLREKNFEKSPFRRG